MPNTLATADWPSIAAQIAARNRPVAVAARMIGSDAPVAVAGTTPTSTSPSATDAHPARLRAYRIRTSHVTCRSSHFESRHTGNDGGVAADNDQQPR